MTDARDVLALGVALVNAANAELRASDERGSANRTGELVAYERLRRAVTRAADEQRPVPGRLVWLSEVEVLDLIHDLEGSA